jgi:uncharacterized protein (DUF1499 family)
MPASAVFAAIAVTVALLALVLRWSELDLRALAMVCVALVLGGAIVAIPLQYLLRGVPAIHDITTDTDNPPAFIAVLQARAAERAGGVDYRNPRIPQLQKKAYPDVVPLMTALPVAQAFGAALEVAQSMPGWTVVASDAGAGRIEASQQSRWFRFTDDIVIRVANDEAGSRIDMRSTSRQGRGDFGVNAARVRAYMGALRKRIG